MYKKYIIVLILNILIVINNNQTFAKYVFKDTLNVATFDTGGNYYLITYTYILCILYRNALCIVYKMSYIKYHISTYYILWTIYITDYIVYLFYVLYIIYII